MQTLYFAYGSNLASRRLLHRVPGAQARGRARLAGFRLVADKPGRDGNAKLNIVRDPAGFVWGALWKLAVPDLSRLDRYEGGYKRIEVVVNADAGARAATTYASRLHGARPGLEPAYRELVLEGAREQRLPPEWVALLESLPER